MNSQCYWCLRRDRETARKATRNMDAISVADKTELLFQHGIYFNELPNWQKRGMGLYWEEYEKEGYNPIKDETVFTIRRRIKRELNLPMKDDYSEFIGEVFGY